MDPLAECAFRFPVGEGGPLHLLHEHARVFATRYDDRYCYVDAVAPASLRRKLRQVCAGRAVEGIIVNIG